MFTLDDGRFNLILKIFIILFVIRSWERGLGYIGVW